MTYVDGFVAAVPQANKAAYLDQVREAAALFKDHGAVRMVENWGDDVPAGKVTDFHRSVRKKDDEAVLFSWIEWPSREARDAGMKALMQDQRMQTLNALRRPAADLRRLLTYRRDGIAQGRRLSSKQARDDAWPKLMADPRMRPDKANISFDAQRMIFGGFATMLHA
jgi:uncharacterized protein YbaA (DUF1428 family)